MKPDRDVDKIYPLPDFIAKLRRLADALEADEPFEIQIAGERIHVPARAIASIEHEREEGHEEIEFQLSWRHHKPADEAEGLDEGGAPAAELAGAGDPQAAGDTAPQAERGHDRDDAKPQD